jgi:subtilisin family serine protease
MSRCAVAAGITVSLFASSWIPAAASDAIAPATPGIASVPSANTGRFKQPHVPGELIVKVREGATKAGLDAIEQSGMFIVDSGLLASSVKLVRATASTDAEATLQAEAALDALSRNPAVEYAEPNYLMHTMATPNDPRFSQQWGLENGSGADISAPQAWDRTTGSEDVVIGVIDSGMDITHVDLKDNLFKNSGEIAGNNIDDDANGYIDDVNGWDAVTDTGRMRDEDGHGTHVSGIVGARGNNGEGVAGVNWKVKLLPLRFITVRSGATFDAMQCIDYATNLRNRGVNLRVLNNSWGGGGFSAALADTIKRANTAGILFVCAAGNEATDSDSVPNFPSGYEVANVISVGAMTRSNFQAGFSNYGRRSVDVFAPGDGILSTTPGNSYASFSGTSQASPMVAGIAGLILAAHPEATVPELKARILGSVQKEGFASSLCLTGGRVDAQAAIRSESGAPATVSDFRLTTVSRSTIALAWTAVGDDGTTGTAAYYDLRWSTDEITTSSFDVANQISDTRVPLRAGETERAVIKGCFAEGQAIHVALRVYDKAGNRSQSSTLVAEPSGDILNFTLAPGPDEFVLGTPLNLKGDDKAATVDLPFDFPFYGASFRTAYVSTNGVVTFDAPFVTSTGSRSDLAAVNGLAPLWFDLRTDGSQPGEDVYVTSSGDELTLRWVAEPFYPAGEAPKEIPQVSFAVTLHANGSVDYVYGPAGNDGLRLGSATPVVGVSDGGCVNLVLDAYSGRDSLKNAPAVTFVPGTPIVGNPPVFSSQSLSSANEGLLKQFTVTASDPEGTPVTIVAALPRNATFDAATGAVRFTPDSAQDGVVQFVFTATDGSGASTSRTVALTVLDNGNLPEVNVITTKKKITFIGIGFRVGARIEIDGTFLGDAKNSKNSPATKITSGSAKAALSTPGLHTVIVENPDGTRSGPFFTIR